jgi:hypothetical protein
MQNLKRYSVLVLVLVAASTVHRASGNPHFWPIQAYPNAFQKNSKKKQQSRTVVSYIEVNKHR